MLVPKNCKTFQGYVEGIFTAYINAEFIHALRIDLIWDQYEENSLKSQTREKRANGSTLRRKVEMSTPIPSKWHDFLKIDTNKTELFRLISETLTSTVTDKELVATIDNHVISNTTTDTTGIAPCNHEEADTRIIVHLADVVRKGFSKVKIRTVDTDVVVLAIAAIPRLPEGTEVWLAFGTGKDFRYIPAHMISTCLGPVKSVSLPVFHSFTGCDTVSHFAKIGKKTAWKIWELNDEVTATFHALHNAPASITEEAALSLERFTILLYDKTSESFDINEARQLLFTRKGRQMMSLPPTQAALRQHTKRAVLQGGYHWGLSMVKNRTLPSPADWGWECQGKWQPVWTDLSHASASCQELLKCRCRSRCFDCVCAKSQLKCTVYCSCRGGCENS